MTKSDIIYLHHMLEAVDNIMKFSLPHDFVSFVEDLETISACAYQVQIIGEAASKISPEFKNQHPDISWQDAIDTRHKLVHHYMKIDPEILWDIVQKDLPLLKEQLEDIL